MEIQHIRQKLADKVAGIAPIGNTLKFLLQADGMDYIVFLDGRGNMNIVSGDDLDADCTVMMKKDTYLKLDRKELNPMFAAMTGKIRVKGNLAVAAKLRVLE